MDECIKFLDNAAVFSTLSVNSGCWELEIHEADRDKIAITSNHKLYRFIRWQLGLRNPSNNFYQTMGAILSAVKRQFALGDLEDIEVF